MAYPFGEAPTWAQLLARLEQLGVRYKPYGGRNWLLQREVGEDVRHYIPSIGSMTERVTPSVLRPLCENLGLDPRLLGYELG